MKIIACGDIHGQFGFLNSFINKRKPDVLLVCGDYGFWPHYHNTFSTIVHGSKFNQYGVKNHQNGHRTRVFWAPGNHENWDELDKFGYTITEIQEDVFYCPFGSVVEINGVSILFVGGADSIDKEWRTPGDTWWQQEVITQKDFSMLPDPNEVKIDIVISHTVPAGFFGNFKDEFKLAFSEKKNDPSCVALDNVLQMFKPKLWFSGHFHKFMKGVGFDYKWFGLADMPFGDRYFVELTEDMKGVK